MPKKTKEQIDREENASAAAASYVWIASIYILLTRPHSAFAQFHARQATLLFGIEIAAGILGPLSIPIILVAIYLSIKGFRAALKGEEWVMPFFGRWLQQQHS